MMDDENVGYDEGGDEGDIEGGDEGDDEGGDEGDDEGGDKVRCRDVGIADMPSSKRCCCMQKCGFLCYRTTSF